MHFTNLLFTSPCSSRSLGSEKYCTASGSGAKEGNDGFIGHTKNASWSVSGAVLVYLAQDFDTTFEPSYAEATLSPTHVPFAPMTRYCILSRDCLTFFIPRCFNILSRSGLRQRHANDFYLRGPSFSPSRPNLSSYRDVANSFRFFLD